MVNNNNDNVVSSYSQNMIVETNTPDYRDDYVLNEYKYEAKEYSEYINNLMDNIIIQFENLEL
tara:strand:- start:1328 stop:1516 length:189 start_codon:yes stop_codon:yes gene_type:complete